MQTLIVDGYNVVHAWPALKRILETRGLEDARDQLVHVLSEYAAHTGTKVTVVFDSHERLETGEAPQIIDGVTVCFGTRTASADHVIERLAQRRSRRGDASQVTVATGDRLQRAIVGAMGVATITSEQLAEDVKRAYADASASRLRHDGPSQTRRIEEHLSQETREKLDAIWSGRAEETPVD